jgi:uncharacterized protein YlaN (UPF0358 family)
VGLAEKSGEDVKVQAKELHFLVKHLDIQLDDLTLEGEKICNPSYSTLPSCELVEEFVEMAEFPLWALITMASLILYKRNNGYVFLSTDTTTYNRAPSRRA